MDTNNIELIQKRYKIYRIEKGLNLFRELALDNLFGYMRFDKMQENLIDKKILTIVNILLNRINRYMNPEQRSIPRSMGRIFLSAYIIKYHSNKIFTQIDKILLEQLVLISKQLIDYVENIFLKTKNYKHYSMDRFAFLFNNYFINYNILRERDKIGLIQELYQEYSNTTITKKYITNGTKYSPEQKIHVLSVIDKHMNDIKKSIKLLDNEFDIQKFEQIVSLEDKIKRNISEKYWSEMVNEIKGEKYELLLENLLNLKEVILSLTPESIKNREKIDMNEYMDIDFLKQRLEHNTLDESQILLLCRYLMDKVKNLQAQVRDNDMEQFWEDCTNKLSTGDISIYGIIPYFLKNMYRIIDDLLCDILLLPILYN